MQPCHAYYLYLKATYHHAKLLNNNIIGLSGIILECNFTSAIQQTEIITYGLVMNIIN